jgi:hypothetical protein
MQFLSWALVGVVLSQATAATTIRRRQYDDPEGDARPDCTTYSFSYPLWRIYDMADGQSVERRNAWRLLVHGAQHGHERANRV